MTELTTIFLIASLFVPRISIFVLYVQNLVPLNPTPFWADVALSVFLPRIMTLILIAVTQGFDGWFAAHLVVAILVYAEGSSSITVKKKS